MTDCSICPLPKHMASFVRKLFRRRTPTRKIVTIHIAQNVTIAYIQELATNQVKQIADSLGSDEARAALHAIVGCAGAAASSQSCGAGAMGASASSLLGTLLGPTTGMSDEDRQARENLVTSLVAGIATASGANAATATNAGQIEVENNQVSLPGTKPKDPLDALKIDLLNKYCGAGKPCTDAQVKQMIQAQGELSQAVNQNAMGVVIVGGGAAALAAAAIAGPETLAAYKAAQAGYSLATGALTGASVSAGSYTFVAAASAAIAKFQGADPAAAFDQHFSLLGLGAAATVGAANGIFGTSMFKWADIPNKITNVSTVPGVVIRLNGFFQGQAAGKAAQAAVNQNERNK